MIAPTRVSQNTDAGHLRDVTPGQAFWAAPADAAGLITAGQAYYAPGGTSAPPPEPSWTANGSPGFAVGTSNCSPPAAAITYTTDGGTAAGVPAGTYDGGTAGRAPSGILDGGHAA